MAATAIDRATGLASSAAFKAPVYVATTANIALSGLLTIDGVALTAGKRVLVKDQSVPAQNGIYIAAASDWQRAPDLTSNDSVREGTRVFVTDGATQAGTEYVVTAADPISIGTTSMTWTSSSLLNAGAVGSAIHNATADTISDADEVGFYETIAGALRKITWANVKATLSTSLGALIAAFTEKTTPVDADNLLLSDSADSNSSKRLTVLNLWNNRLKAKADLLYQPLKAILTTLGNLSNASGVLTNNGSGSLSWGSASSGGMTLLGTITTTSGATQALTGLSLSAYKYLLCELVGVSHNDGSNQSLTLALSSTGGAAYGTAVSVTGAVSGVGGFYGPVEIWGINSTVAAGKGAVGKAAHTVTAQTGLSPALSTNTAAVVDAIRFGWSTGSFDAGSINVYGVK